jgi:hypothetical protein
MSDQQRKSLKPVPAARGVLFLFFIVARPFPRLLGSLLLLLSGLSGRPLQAAAPVDASSESRRSTLVASVEHAVQQVLAREANPALPRLMSDQQRPQARSRGSVLFLFFIVGRLLGLDAPVGLRSRSARGPAGAQLTLAFNREIAGCFEPGSLAFEALSRSIHRAVGTVLDPVFSHYEVYTVIDGVPLHALLAELDGPADVTVRQAAPSEPGPRPPGTAALSARRVAVSPGHGYYFNGTTWVLQRSPFFGIVEDFINHDLITLVDEELRGPAPWCFPPGN